MIIVTKDILLVMRDIFIETLYARMHKDKRIFFLSADFGSPKLDIIRKRFPDRFINVGIAEQNLINIATGLALEGFIVYAYAIAPFLVMRPYEQIRVNLSLQSQLRPLNVNLIGVGAGLSYDVSGPTHHCLEDISIMRTLPNITFFSPSDSVLVEKFVDYSIRINTPKYLRFDGKPLPQLYKEDISLRIEDGYRELKKGKKVCLVTTGFTTHMAIRAADTLKKDIGVIDVFLLKPFNSDSFSKILKKYESVVTIEEGFIHKGGLDSLIRSTIDNEAIKINFKAIGFQDSYVFDIGSRDYLHKLYGLDEVGIVKIVNNLLKR